MFSLTALIFLSMLNLIWCAEIDMISADQNKVNCQHRSTSGRDYRGRANTTETGIPCQMWSDTQPHDHQFTHVGDHNFCRNPTGSQNTRVWCYTSDPSIEGETCSVTFCPSLKVLDFSLDNDWEPDLNDTYTYASILKENFPSSFTICTAFMVEWWGMYQNSPLFRLLDDFGKNKKWLYVEVDAAPTHTGYTVVFSGIQFAATSPSIFFRFQWTRLCLSFNTSTSMVTLVVDGNQLAKKFVVVEKNLNNLNMIIGWGDHNQKNPGKITDVNIFSTALTNMEEMTMAGTKKCGAPGDYVNWEEADWNLYSEARIIEVDSAMGPCKKESKMSLCALKMMF